MVCKASRKFPNKSKCVFIDDGPIAFYSASGQHRLPESLAEVWTPQPP